MKEHFPCAIYTRKSSEEGLEQGFNSLDAQREACEAFVLSQKAMGWKVLPTNYDDGGFSGGNTERPALKKLMADITAKRIRIVVVYKVDRLTRSLADFAKLVELFDAHGVSFVSVTQQFNTTSSMGRLTLNVLLSFAQFEREVTGERIRDKIAASKRKGMWMGGVPPVGYHPHERTLLIDEPAAKHVREIYRLYLELGNVSLLKTELDQLGWITPLRKTQRDNAMGGKPYSRGHLYRILSNPIYIGKIAHKESVFDGNHPAIVDEQIWMAVQHKLSGNLEKHRTRSTAADPSLLTSLVFDDLGNPMSPSHTKKGAKRYRYYIARSLVISSRNKSPEALRLPATELEDVVLSRVCEVLIDESRLLSYMGDSAVKDIRQRTRHASILAQQLSDGCSSDKIAILKQIVSRITVFSDRVDVSVRINSILGITEIAENEEYISTINIPVQLKRCGMAVRLIVKTPGASTVRGPDQKMVSIILKAHQWFEKLRSGQCANIQALAIQEKVTRSYVTRVVYLAFLDPFIVQKIMQGQHPLELNADKLKRLVPLPIDWREQRTLLGKHSS